MLHRSRTRLLAGVFLLIGSLLPLYAQGRSERPSLEVWFFDVGQGDATLVIADGTRLLVDGGRGRDVMFWLDSLRIDSLDLVVATHPDRDHIGGLEFVLSTRHVGAFMDNDRPHPSQSWRVLRQLIATLNVPQRTPVRHVEHVQRGALTLTVYPPPPIDLPSNNESIGIIARVGDFSLFLTGDAEQTELQHWLGLGVPSVTVLKASHHGSRNGLTPGWMAATAPEAVVISVGRDNAYGHPDPWALRYYGLGGRRIWRTDVHSTIRLRAWADGTFEVETAAVELPGRRTD